MNNFLTYKEEQDIAKVVHIGRSWGYGNVIDRLKFAWAASLVKEGLPIETACKHAGIDDDERISRIKKGGLDGMLEYCGLRKPEVKP